MNDIPAAQMPLLVIAAGNDGDSAFWAGFPNVRQDFPQNVLVVAASGVSGLTLVPPSNHGSLVEIAAPGSGIGILDRNGNQTTASGTSVAAPFVAGVAGLLRSFDPNLTLNEVRQHIIAGARGTAGGIPLLNAYEALKLAARRPGAPLCGNHVYAAGGKVWAVRGDVTDSLKTVGRA
jgi:subtilisin family serine protease